MRISLACSWCRSSKVKCIHTGQAPCTSCAKRSRECVLMLPEIAIIADEKKRKLKEEIHLRKKKKSQKVKETVKNSYLSVAQLGKNVELLSKNNEPKFEELSRKTSDRQCVQSSTEIFDAVQPSLPTETVPVVSHLSKALSYENQPQHHPHILQGQLDGYPTQSYSESYRTTFPPSYRALPVSSQQSSRQSSQQSFQPLWPLYQPVPQIPPDQLPQLNQSQLNLSHGLPLPSKLRTRSRNSNASGPANSSTLPNSPIGIITMTRPHNQCLESLKGTPLENVSMEIIQECCEILINLFPEMCIVHPALNSFPEMIKKEDKLVLTAIVALCARYISQSAADCSKLSDSSVEYILQQSTTQVFLEPSVPMIKALLLVSLSTWGEGKDYLSWMVHGTASRMLQYVHCARKDNNGPNLSDNRDTYTSSPTDSYSTQSRDIDTDGDGILNEPPVMSDGDLDDDDSKRTLDEELRIRTQWAGFFMDILISSGKDRPRAFQKGYTDSIPLPCNDEEFLFAFMDSTGVIKDRRMYMTDVHHIKNHQYRNCYLHKIFHIWGRITAWITSGGRHRPGELRPWDKNSTWYKLNKELRDFKRELPARLRFSKTSFHAFKARNLAVIIGMINLTEFVCLAGLHREYLPFFPIGMPEPQGPNVPPLFTDSPPPDKDFWIKSTQTLFESSRNIAQLINFYKLNKVPIYTPFVGYCAFTSSVMCYYASLFPFMDPSKQFSSSYNQNLANDMTQYLAETSKYWAIAKSWYRATIRIRKLYYDIAMQKDKLPSLSRQSYIEFEKLIENIEHNSLTNDSDISDNSSMPEFSRGELNSDKVSKNSNDQLQSQQLNSSRSGNISQSLYVPEIPSVNIKRTLLPLAPEFPQPRTTLNDHGYRPENGLGNYISEPPVANPEENSYNLPATDSVPYVQPQPRFNNSLEIIGDHSQSGQHVLSGGTISMSTGEFGQSDDYTVFNELFSDFRSLDDFFIIPGLDDNGIQSSLASMLSAIGASDSAEDTNIVTGQSDTVTHTGHSKTG